MITAIRRIFSSKLGAAIALAFVLLMGLAFAVTDVNGFMGGGTSGVSGGNVARVGDRQISMNELRQRIDRAYDRQRAENPGLSREQFIASGAIDSILGELIDVYAVEQYARENGFGIDKAVIDRAIASNPQFAGITGNFDQTVFDGVLRQMNTNERDVRRDLENAGIARQLLGPFATVRNVPENIALPYTALLLESREGQATFIPAARFRPTGNPTDAQLQTYYRSQQARYMMPERRAIRYALLDESAVRTPPTVTDAEIATEYRANPAVFAARETRNLSQVITSDRAVADRIAAAARGGQSLSAAATAAGLAAASLSEQTRERYTAATNAEAARAVFAASDGALIGPIAVPLGFAIIRVEDVDSRAAVTLAEATPPIRTRLLERKRQEALVDVYNGIQDALSNGSTVAEVAEERGLTIRTTPPLISSGTAPGDASFRPDPLLPALVSPAFAAGEGDPAQIITLQENRIFALVEVARIIPAAPPALATIRERVSNDWRLAEGARQARTRARAIVTAIERGTGFAAAAQAQGASDGVQRLGGRRLQLVQGQGRVPPEISLLFSMAPGTARTLELPNNAGWMVINLNRIIRGNPAENAELVAQVRQQFGPSLGREYVQSLVNAARRSVGVTISDETVAELRRQLTGSATAPVN
jgi:peptidyl-prolyl cis-trans isomerase D